MQEVSFEDALEIITIKDPRYPREAYLFVREALDHTQKLLAKERQGCIRHVSGQELLIGIRDYASKQFGPMALMVLQEWGIRSCQDFGELVFNMVETGGCPTLSADDITGGPALLELLKQHNDPVSLFLWESFSEPARLQLKELTDGPEVQQTLTKELNRLIISASLFEEKRFAGVAVPAEVRCLADRQLSGVPLAQFNRLLLESAYPRQIAKSHGLLAKTKDDSRTDFEDGYDFFEAFRKPFLPPSKQTPSEPDPAPSTR